MHMTHDGNRNIPKLKFRYEGLRQRGFYTLQLLAVSSAVVLSV